MTSVGPAAALGAAVARLLAASGRADLAAVVERVSIELVDPAERWQVGSRTVAAHRFAVVADIDDFVRLRTSADDFEALREALAAAVRSATVELAEVFLVLRLPWIGRTWEAAYRDGPAPTCDETSDEAVLEGAASLAEAMADGPARRALGGARLESAEVPSTDGVLRRYVVHLRAADLAAAEADPDLAERIRRPVVHAATRATVRVVDVELRLRLG